jgi:hypothetical protein
MAEICALSDRLRATAASRRAAAAVATIASS